VTFLQFLVREKLIKRTLQLPLGCFITGHLRAMKPCPQAFELVVDFTAAGFECVSQGRINAAQLLDAYRKAHPKA